MTKIIAGLFMPLSGDQSLIFNVLTSVAEVRPICVGQSNLGPIDILIYPDNLGILPNISGLTLKNRTFIPSKPINPHFFQFWEDHNIDDLIEERELKIIGMGDAAAMLYSHIGGKVIIDQQGNGLLVNHLDEAFGLDDLHIDHLGNDKDLYIEGFVTKDRNIAGVTTFETLRRAVYLLSEEVRSFNGGSEPVAIPRTPVPPPFLTGYNN